MSLARLLQMLANFSEQAAALARTIREDETLFQLLVEEKTGSQKNIRFAQDFKTLADVLIQQTLCYKVAKEFPAMSGRVFGEECAVFSNALGESVTVAVQDSEQHTAQMLTKVLDGNMRAATTLANLVHRTDISVDVNIDKPVQDIPLDKIAIWIDPIDSTGEYISGDEDGSKEEKSPGHKIAGLVCVTVLVGVFVVEGGVPVLGVINQPFLHPAQTQQQSVRKKYRGQMYCGVAGPANNLAHKTQRPSVPLTKVLLSSSERKDVQDTLTAAGVQSVAAAGAGFKCLSVILREAQIYLCSKGSTYMWDTCAPHSILLSMGGGVIPFTSLTHFTASQPPDHLEYQICYKVPSTAATSNPATATCSSSSSTDANITSTSAAGDNCDDGGSIAPFCNTDGVVAYYDLEHLYKLARLLAK